MRNDHEDNCAIVWREVEPRAKLFYGIASVRQSLTAQEPAKPKRGSLYILEGCLKRIASHTSCFTNRHNTKISRA